MRLLCVATLRLRVMDVLFVAECSVQSNAYIRMVGCVLQICPVPFHLKSSLHLFVLQVERCNMGFVWVCTQCVASVVLCEFALCDSSIVVSTSTKEGC